MGKETPMGNLLDLPIRERIQKLADVIAKGGDEAQQIRRLPEDTKDALIDAGIFRFAMPTELGGENATITETVDILADICAIDASVGWNVMLGSEINAMAAGGMDPELAREVFLESPRTVMCGGGGPGSQPSYAIKQEDGSFKVWGETTFISGVHNSEWCFMGAPIMENDAPLLDDAGNVIIKMFFLNKSQFEIIDSWDVAGLRGSGSHSVRAEGANVPAKYVDVDLVAMPAHYPNPAFRVPVPLRLAYNKAAVAIGVARGAIDAFVDLAHNKVPMLSPSKLMDRPIAQIKLAECEAKYRAAYAYLMNALRDVEDELNAGDDMPGAAVTQNARLACIYAGNACMEVVDTIHNAAGTSASYMANPLERKLRDAHGAATHRWIAHPLYQDLGSILMGNEATPEFAGTGGPALGAKLKRDGTV
jgi:alkylation response protein AidB-like acyl-CoA dehydrogenase